LERALRLSDRLGGHLVSGHVDAVTEVISSKKIGQFTIFSFQTPINLDRYIVEKGSITIDGISLTVNSCEGGKFSISIIPHTLGVTTLGGIRPGSKVNLEVDIIGKYVEKLLKIDPVTQLKHNTTKLDKTFLAANGFLK
ncbi:MAG: riboflavin synthase, partial [Deltaproteobacteria bacterium]|nr:riboflavin synthase [Deltaproteobacteria bacterium]